MPTTMSRGPVTMYFISSHVPQSEKTLKWLRVYRIMGMTTMSPAVIAFQSVHMS